MMNTTKTETGQSSAFRAILRPIKSAALSVLHPIRERRTRMPNLPFLLSAPALNEKMRGHLEELNRDGITKISGMISAPDLKSLQDSVDRFAARLDQQAPAFAKMDNEELSVLNEYYSESARLYSSNEPFTFCPEIMPTCLNGDLVGLVDHYLGKPAQITQGVVTRMLSHPKSGFGSFQWHHDAWGKRVNVMIVLTKVAAEDQGMTFIKGSHKFRHPLRKYENSRFNDEEVKQSCDGMEVFRCVAEPGDIYVFDSNGIHSGNRTQGRVRDTFIFCYTHLANTIWAHKVPAEYVAGYTPEQLRPLDWIRKQDRAVRALAPEINSWVGELPKIGKWLF